MHKHAFLPIVFALALILAGGVQAQASQSVWSGLVMANNVAEPDETPPELHAIESTLKALFGYNQFKVIGQSLKTVKTGSEEWLTSSKYFALRVDSKSETDSCYLLTLKLYQEKNLLLETEAKLSSSGPLVIKGPLVGSGQLLLVLVLQ